MLKHVRKLAAGILLAGVTSLPALADTIRVPFVSANRATTIDFLYKGRVTYDETIYGDLTVPDNARSPTPAMVILHGSGGVDDSMARRWESFFKRHGIATFVVDSFSPRGIGATATDQSQITYTTSGIDALKALEALAKDPRIDPSRIGVIGFSRGGVATQQSAFERFKSSVIPGQLKFAVHFALYGGCAQYGSTTGAPVIHFVGDADDTLNVEQCRITTNLSNELGANNRLVVYHKAMHGFDREGAWKYSPFMTTWKECRVMVNMRDQNSSIPSNERARFSELVAYRETCKSKGVHYGGDSTAARETEREVMQALEQLGFGLR